MTLCEVCHAVLNVGDYPFCKGDAARHVPSKTAGVIADSIPGGIEIKHGLCHPDGSPRRFDSHSDIRKAAKKAGMTNYVVHQPPPGSDKSKWTSRWV